jgi:hypothetical protein
MLIYTSKLRIFIPCMPCQKLPKHAKMVLGGAGLRRRLRLRGMVLIYFVNEYHLGAWPSASLEGDGINLLRK